MIKTKMLVSAAAAALMLSTSLLPAGPLASMPAQAQAAGVSFSLFFEQLEPHGVWVRHPQHRYVFCPTGVDTRWRPYTEGRWVYLADYGWYFQSEEPFAWATYHYGRWLDDDILDEMLTLYVNGGRGERLGDGVDTPTKPASLSFPYVREPNNRVGLSLPAFLGG